MTRHIRPLQLLLFGALALAVQGCFILTETFPSEENHGGNNAANNNANNNVNNNANNSSNNTNNSTNNAGNNDNNQSNNANNNPNNNANNNTNNNTNNANNNPNNNAPACATLCERLAPCAFAFHGLGYEAEEFPARCLSACEQPPEPVDRFSSCLLQIAAEPSCAAFEECLHIERCEELCAEIDVVCAGTFAPAPAACVEACLSWPHSADDQPTTNTFECREQSVLGVVEQPIACEALVTGGEVCVGPSSECVGYCGAALTNCTDDQSLYADEAACLEACRGFRVDPLGDDADADTVQCRLRYANLAAGDPGACAAAAELSAACVNPE